jgi:protein TonB
LTIASALPAQGTVPRRIQVDGATQAKSLVYRLKPEIPPGAKAAGVSGTVVLHAVVGIDGRPCDLQYVSGPRLLAQAARDAVKWREYRVAVVDAGLASSRAA